MGLVLDLWVVCSSEKPLDRHVKLIGNLRQPVNVQGSDSGIFDVDGLARARADAARMPVRCCSSQIACLEEPFEENSEITGTHPIKFCAAAAMTSEIRRLRKPYLSENTAAQNSLHKGWRAMVVIEMGWPSRLG